MSEEMKIDPNELMGREALTAFEHIVKERKEKVLTIGDTAIEMTEEVWDELDRIIQKKKAQLHISENIGRTDLSMEEKIEAIRQDPLASQLFDMLIAERMMGQYQQQTEADEIADRYNGPVKINPSEIFISCGPGPEQGRWYGCLMKPSPGSEEGFAIVSTMHEGFETKTQAKYAAASYFTSVPVLMDDNKTFEYPFYRYRPNTAKVLTDAEQKRQAKRDRQLARLRKGQSNGNGH